MEKVYIYGAGENGRRLFDILQTNYYGEYDICGICDGNKCGDSFRSYIIGAPRDIPRDSTVIIAIFDEAKMIEIYDCLYECGIKKIYWFNGKKKSNQEGLFDAWCEDCSKWGGTVVRHIEVNLANHCNLNCKCCSHFSALFEPEFPNEQELYLDILQLNKKFSHIMNLYLMGGEPLLNENIGRIIVKIREILPCTRLVIVTNGLLLPKLEAQTLRIIKDNDVHIDISEYVPTKKLIPKIEMILTKAGISYTIKKMKSDSFYKLLSISDNSIYEKKCLADGCYDVWKGQIARCPMLMYLDKFNEKFGTSLPRVGVFDIYSDISGEELIMKLKNRIPLCEHCIAKKIKWEQCGKDIVISDFAEVE